MHNRDGRTDGQVCPADTWSTDQVKISYADPVVFLTLARLVLTKQLFLLSFSMLFFPAYFPLSFPGIIIRDFFPLSEFFFPLKVKKD